MLFSRKLKINKYSTFAVLLVVAVIATYNYLNINNVEVFIETNKIEREQFIIYTSISYFGLEGDYATGGITRMIESDSAQELPIQLENILFFNRFQAWIYHPDYIRQSRNKNNRTFLRTVKFPRFMPQAWKDVISKNVKVSISEPNYFVKDVGAYLKAVESGKIVRIIDVMGHLRLFKEDYMPLYLTQGSKKQLRRYLPRLKELVSYAKENIDVGYEQLEEHDHAYLRKADQYLLEIEEMLR